MLNPNPNNSQRLENSSLAHRWEIPGRLSSSIKQIDKIETYTNRIPAKLLLLLITESFGFLYKISTNPKEFRNTVQYNSELLLTLYKPLSWPESIQFTFILNLYLIQLTFFSQR